MYIFKYTTTLVPCNDIINQTVPKILAIQIKEYHQSIADSPNNVIAYMYINFKSFVDRVLILFENVDLFVIFPANICQPRRYYHLHSQGAGKLGLILIGM